MHKRKIAEHPILKLLVVQWRAADSNASGPPVEAACVPPAGRR